MSEEPLGRDPEWMPIAVSVDGARVPADQAITAGWQLIALEFGG